MGIFEKKYGKALTVILIIIAIVVIAAICYLVYQTIATNAVNNDGAKSAQEFRDKVKVTKKNPTAINDIEVNLQAPETTTKPKVTEREKQYYQGFEMIGTIEIPATGVDYPILLETTAASMKVAITLQWPMQDPDCLNQPGNVVLAGHNYKNGTFFSNNKSLKENDKVFITDLDGNRMSYRIASIQILSPEEFSYAQEDTDGKCVVWLSTCTDDVQSRIVIKCVEG